MADINAISNLTGMNGSMNTAAPESPQVKRAPETNPAVQPEQQRPEEVAREEKREAEELDDVVSVSKDGDTVQVKPESAQKLEDDAFGTMIRLSDDDEEEKAETEQQVKENEKRREEIEEAVERNREAAERRAENAEKQAGEAEEDQEELLGNNNITSYAGYTDSQLETMYLKGDISKIDYDKEMTAREERREAETTNTAEFNQTMTANALQERKVEISEESLKLAFAPTANNETIRPEDRVDIVEKLQDVSSIAST
ncbi:MAG: hypothetical protein K5985_12160 [Lachnospiraceae bacterium]|nr:hypothetical protein [Lachnospiraceae bacterium]